MVGCHGEGGVEYTKEKENISARTMGSKAQVKKLVLVMNGGLFIMIGGNKGKNGYGLSRKQNC